MYLYVEFKTGKKLNELKFGDDENTMMWLKRERIFLKVDRWNTARVRSVGCITRVHPTLTWKADLKQ